MSAEEFIRPLGWRAWQNASTLQECNPVPEAQQLMFPLVRKADRECNSADKNQANGPSIGPD